MSEEDYNYRITFSRMIKYDLDDEEDNVANYLILSLQPEQIVPQLSVKYLYALIHTYIRYKYAKITCPVLSEGS